jgi:Zn-dependent M28 family amino/carboxypeptidase
MSRTKAIAISFVVCLLAAFCAAAPAPAPAAGYRKAGESALEWTRQFVALGPRPSDSPAHRRQQALIINELKRLNATMVEEKFTAQTPNGPLAMNNIIAKFPGTSDRIVVLSGHYDTYNRPGLHFVGANDGGSSAGLLLALAAELKGEPRRNAVWLLFLDGEESIRAWQDNDNTYGSRHQVGKWTEDGTIPKITALINVDMIGDADLELLYEGYSTPWLRDLVWETGNDLGYPTVFAQTTPSYIEDDHRPFLDAGVPAVDLIDFHYGPSNRYWHTEEDTVDKLSARSFGVMAHVVLETVQKLEQR